MRARCVVKGAFVEALRLDMPTQFMARTVARETTNHGQKLRPGQGMLFLYASANRDERRIAWRIADQLRGMTSLPVVFSGSSPITR